MAKQFFSFAEDNSPALWLGTEHGLIRKGNNGSQERFLIDKKRSSRLNQVRYFEKDNNKFWLITSGGLSQFDLVTKTFTAYRHQPGNVNSVLSDSILDIKKGSDNKLWIGTSNGLDQMDTKTGSFKHFQNSPTDPESISNDHVNTINIDKNKTLWVGTNIGLSRFDDQTGHFKRYLTQSPVYCITEDKEGDLWVGTDAGLFRYNKEEDIFLFFKDETAIITSTTSTYIISITEDSDQNLWLFTFKGIIRLNKERNSAILYGKNQGVNGAAIRGIGFTRNNGEILCGDTSGYFAFRPELLQQYVLPPTIILSNFLLKNIPVQPSSKGILTVPLMQTKEIRLKFDQNTFSFQLQNIDFSREREDTRLLYMLQNYDDTWHKAGEEKNSVLF